MEAPREDAERLNRLASGHETFMSAASPGVTALFFPNQYYASDEEYVFALAEGLRHEYETIAAAGITLQVDCPDLAMGRHVQFTHLGLEEFRKRIGMNVAALNHALRNIPAEQCRMHLCWGNYPGPHHCDVPLADIADISGMDGVVTAQMLEDGTDLELVAREDQIAREMGVTGVPAMIFGGRLAVSGAQAAEVLVEAAQRVAREVNHN